MAENIKFRWLQAIAITVIVLGHYGGLDISFGWFAYYNFNVALFIFIAGYFQDTASGLVSYLWKRIKRLVIPYYKWNLIYGILMSVLVINGWSQLGSVITPLNLLTEPLVSNTAYGLNGAAWFALALFIMQAAYAILRKMLRVTSARGEFLFLGICFCIGFLGIALSQEPYLSIIRLPVIRTMFGLPFLQFGHVYSLYLEKYDTPSLKKLTMIFVVQAFVLYYWPAPFFFVGGGNFYGQVYFPILLSLNGIWFWLQAASYLSRVGSNRVIRLVGGGTWDIMVHQQACVWLLNTFFFLIGVSGFDVGQYKTNIVYAWTPNNDLRFRLLYSVFAISFPLLCRLIFNAIVSRLKEKQIGILHRKRSVQE